MSKRKRQVDRKSRTVEGAINKDLIRQLRTKIMVASPDSKVIAITSSNEGEGKTTIAFNLADSLNAAGKKSIYIDGSLRKDSVAEKLGTFAASGLSSYLSESLQSKDLIIRQVSGVDYILNTVPTEISTELLESDVFSQLINKLRSEYDFIILDTPDMASCSDAVVISKLADAIIHVVEAGRTSGEKVNKDIRYLEETNTPVIGVALNKIKYN